MERLSPALHAPVRRAMRQARALDDAAKAEKLIRNLAHRLERDAPAGRVAALARLHKHHREHDGHGASRHPQREALEFAFDGPTLDCRDHARIQEGLSKAPSLQACEQHDMNCSKCYITMRPCVRNRVSNASPHERRGISHVDL
jgi:hypothetical protein